MFVSFLQCTLCGKRYAPNAVKYVCPDHGESGVLDVVYDYAEINRHTAPAQIAQASDKSIWRYWDLLPLETRDSVPPLPIGWTPLWRAGFLGRSLGLQNLYFKDDGRNPTASFKDRASAVVVAKACELGADIITTASTGNAGAALAGVAASARLPSVIFVPENAPPAKIAQLLIYGARVLLVRGSYDQAFELCLAASKEFGWYCRSTAYNPYTTEGKKTGALEICEQLTLINQGLYSPVTRASREMLVQQIEPPDHWEVPDRIFVSVGDGNIISGIWKGLRDLYALGWIDRLPKLMGIQAEGAAACYNAWRAGTDQITPVHANTVADSISADLPRDGVRAVRAVRESGGEYITVSDQEILDEIRELARGEGVFVEPAASAAYAGLVKAVRAQKIDPAETIVVMLTGSGLKDIHSAMRAAGNAQVIQPTLEAVRAAIAN
ncbi:MAG TPA: threonine synthase [Anaerolineae bacterium]|nr:threonine synthase [Anaerolineae bacterium]